MVYILGIHIWFNIQKLINILHHNNKLKKKSHNIISLSLSLSLYIYIYIFFF